MKLKSHSGTKKRVRIRGKNQKFMKKAARNHLLTHKSKRQKDLFDKGKPVHHSNLKALDLLLPYSN